MFQKVSSLALLLFSTNAQTQTPVYPGNPAYAYDVPAVGGVYHVEYHPYPNANTNQAAANPAAVYPGDPTALAAQQPGLQSQSQSQGAYTYPATNTQAAAPATNSYVQPAIQQPVYPANQAIPASLQSQSQSQAATSPYPASNAQTGVESASQPQAVYPGDPLTGAQAQSQSQSQAATYPASNAQSASTQSQAAYPYPAGYQSSYPSQADYPSGNVLPGLQSSSQAQPAYTYPVGSAQPGVQSAGQTQAAYTYPSGYPYTDQAANTYNSAPYGNTAANTNYGNANAYDSGYQSGQTIPALDRLVSAYNTVTSTTRKPDDGSVAVNGGAGLPLLQQSNTAYPANSNPGMPVLV